MDETNIKRIWKPSTGQHKCAQCGYDAQETVSGGLFRCEWSACGFFMTAAQLAKADDPEWPNRRELLQRLYDTKIEIRNRSDEAAATTNQLEDEAAALKSQLEWSPPT